MDASSLAHVFPFWPQGPPLTTLSIFPHSHPLASSLGKMGSLGGFTNDVGLYTGTSCEVGCLRLPAFLLVARWAPPPLCLWVCFIGRESVTGPRRLQFVHRSASRWNAATFPDNTRSLSTEERKKDSIRSVDMDARVPHEAVLILEGGWVLVFPTDANVGVD